MHLLEKKILLSASKEMVQNKIISRSSDEIVFILLSSGFFLALLFALLKSFNSFLHRRYP